MEPGSMASARRAQAMLSSSFLNAYPKPVIMQETVQPVSTTQPHADVIALDAMPSSVPTYQPEDLDVPAFLRKRTEVM